MRSGSFAKRPATPRLLEYSTKSSIPFVGSLDSVWDSALIPTLSDSDIYSPEGVKLSCGNRCLAMVAAATHHIWNCWLLT
mmetsp:Transcript_68940/g.165452  ORF Transcript_68940/g.165452 Transcript_68940/m.165452 type:complete len:80 (+) Transcript_68940:848-1087(+)